MFANLFLLALESVWNRKFNELDNTTKIANLVAIMQGRSR